MNSLPRKNYALNRVSHLTKSSHAIAIQAITANLSRIRHSYSTVSSIDLQSLNLSQIFTTYLNLMARAPLRSNLLAHGTSCISPGGSSSASSYFTKPINVIAAAGYEPSHSPALSTRTCLLSRFLLSLSTIFQIERTHPKNHIFRC